MGLTVNNVVPLPAPNIYEMTEEKIAEDEKYCEDIELKEKRAKQNVNDGNGKFRSKIHLLVRIMNIF